MEHRAQTPPARRPGGRSARVRAAVLDATAAELVDKGLAALDVAAVARRADVGRTTVYRRWATVPGLVADLLEHMAVTSLPRTHTGSLRGDLEANATLVARTLADPRQGRLFTAIIAAATHDAATAAALNRFYRTRIDEWSPCVREAVARGELPDGTDADDVVRAVSAPLYYRLLTTGSAPDEPAALRAAAAAIAAAQAGVFVSADR